MFLEEFDERKFLFGIQIVDEDWYPKYDLTGTQKAQGGVQYNSAHHLEDSRGPWLAPQGVDNYIYKNICKIGK
jgi:hypothetical protein